MYIKRCIKNLKRNSPRFFPRISSSRGEREFRDASNRRIVTEESWRDGGRVLSSRFTHGCTHNRELRAAADRPAIIITLIHIYIVIR